MDEVTCTHVYVFGFVLLISVSVFVPVPYGFHYCASQIYLEIWNHNPFIVVFFFYLHKELDRDFKWDCI